MEKLCQTWKLDRYARNINKGNDPSNKEPTYDWEFFDSGAKILELTLLDDTHIFVHHGKTLMESLSLPASKTWMRGISKDDSLLVLYRLQGDTRRFRIKFSAMNGKSSVENAQACCKILSKLFPVKVSEQQQQTGSDKSLPGTDNRSCATLQNEVPLSEIGKILSKDLQANLPLAYQHHVHIQTEHVGTFLKLCLSDANFPAFVETVEKELNVLKNEL